MVDFAKSVDCDSGTVGPGTEAVALYKEQNSILYKRTREVVDMVGPKHPGHEIAVGVLDVIGKAIKSKKMSIPDVLAVRVMLLSLAPIVQATPCVYGIFIMGLESTAEMAFAHLVDKHWNSGRPTDGD